MAAHSPRDWRYDRLESRDDRQDQRISALEQRLFDFQMTLIWVVWIVVYALILACAIVATQL